MRMKFHAQIYLLITAILLSGCSTKQQSVVARNDDFIIIKTGTTDSYSYLAEKYLGSKSKASIIKRYNPGFKAQDNQIAIPLRNQNTTGVFIDGYQRIPVLCYHQFTSKDTGSSMVIPAKLFEQQMAYLKDNNYQVIALRDLHPFLEGKAELPDKVVVITIDDGYKSYYSIAYPILKKYGYASTVFIYPDFIGAGLALKWKQVNLLDNDPLVDIQSHSKSHSSLSKKPGGENQSSYLDRLAIEVNKTDSILDRKIGKTAEHFAYPYGNSSQELIELLQKEDYQLAVTVNQGGNASFASPYLIRRTIIYGEDTLSVFKNRLDVFKKINLR